MKGEPCCICGSDRLGVAFEKKGIAYYRCLGCGFVFSQPASNANFENTLEEYEPAYLTYLDNAWEDELNLKSLLRWTQRFGAVEGARVLDVGTGSGKLVRFLRQRSVDAYGIEPAGPLYARFLADAPFFFNTSVEAMAAALPLGRFNVIFACDVIEHVARPDVFMECISHLLEPGGMLCLSTPDVGSAIARICGKRWHFYNKYHLSYLSRTTIGLLLSRCGLREAGFAHMSRFKSCGYIVQYLGDFIMGGRRHGVPERIKKWCVPVNLFDVMHVACMKPRARGATAGSVGTALI